MPARPPHESAARAALLLTLTLAACSGGSAGPGASPAAKPREAARVRTAPVEKKEMVRTISTTTTVESEREIKLYPRASGVVTSLAVEEGDVVKAGAVLAELDRRATQTALEEARVSSREAEDAARKAQLGQAEAENRVAQTRIKWEQATREFERNEKAGLVSAQALDNLRSARDTASSEHDAAKLAGERAKFDLQAAATQKDKAALAVQRAELEDSFHSIVAPFAGVVAVRSIKVGDSVSGATAAFTLTDPSALRAIVHRPQRELPLFLAAQQRPEGAGLEIRVLAEALPGRVFSGEIQLVSPSIDPQSGSFRVTVKLPETAPGDTAARLLPGMLVRLEIVTERHKDALAVPKRALRREGGSDMVFVADAGHARRVEVREGFSDDECVELVQVSGAPIAAGARVVVVGNRELEDGAEVVEETAEPAAKPAGEAASAPPAAPGKG